MSFEYNAQGLRTKKIANATETKYFWAGDKLLAERRLPDGIEATLPLDDDEVTTFPTDTVIQYLYGFNGVAGFTVTVGDQTESYYYRKNLQGDITHIHNELGTPVAEYVYDAWGNHEITVNTNGIADINPFRYRGYYYDVETKLYYLKSRYYDPETGRFINMDDARVLGKTKNMLNGLNLYAYSLNNPIMMIDSNGRYPVDLFHDNRTLFDLIADGLKRPNPISGNIYIVDPKNTPLGTGSVGSVFGQYFLEGWKVTDSSWYLIKAGFTLWDLKAYIQGTSGEHFSIAFADITIGLGIAISEDFFKFGLQTTAASVGYEWQNVELFGQHFHNIGASILIGSTGLTFELDKSNRTLTIAFAYIFGIKLTFRW